MSIAPGSRRSFQAAGDRWLHGRQRLDGSSTLYVDSGDGTRRRQGVELHEAVHAELWDHSAFGWLQRFLHTVEQAASTTTGRDAARVLDLTMAASALTQEGLATLREYAWVASVEGASAATAFRRLVPPEVVPGLGLAVALFGDPVQVGYHGYPPPVYHIAVSALGTAVLNSTVLIGYSTPDRIAGADLPGITNNHPDHRFTALALGAGRAVAMELLRQVAAKLTVPFQPRQLLEFHDLARQLVVDEFPDLPVVSVAERHTQQVAVYAGWLPWLREHFPFTVVEDYDRPGHVTDLTAERSLRQGYSRGNEGPHEAKEREPSTVDLDTFVAYHRAERFEHVYRLVMISTDPMDVHAELLPHAQIVVGSWPLRLAVAGAGSPLVRYEHWLAAAASTPEFLRRAPELAEAGVLWYTHASRFRALERLADGPLPGLSIARCDAPYDLLTAAWRQPGDILAFGIYPCGEELVLAMITGAVFGFALGSVLQAAHFEIACQERGIAAHDGGDLPAGWRTINPLAVARAALWGFVGR